MDGTSIINTFIATIPVTITAIAGLMIAIRSKKQSVVNSEKIDNVHRTVNGNLTKQLEDAKRQGYLEAKNEGKEETGNKDITM